MTTITLPRAVVEQALEFIRAMNEHGWLLADYESDMERTVAGLEAALAQEQAEPVATITECEACFTPDVCQLRGTCDHYAASQLRVAAQPKRPAEPVQEPWEHLKRYGYAPGNYMSKCRRCGAVPIMDKRAITCRACAEALHAESQKAEPFTPDAIAHTQTAWKMGYEARKAEEQAEPGGAAGLLTLAHLWAQQAYFKGLGRPCDIDGARGAFEQALKAQEQAEPVQEPVAWSPPSALDWESHQSEKMLKVTRSRQDEYGFTQRLYTAPPKLVPLTNEEIALIDWESLKTKLDCVRAVERALEEKNRGR